MISRTAFNPTNPTASSPRNSPSLANTISNLNDEVGDFEDAVFEGYIRETATATQLSSNSFSLSGDLTEWYTEGRKLRFNEATTAVYCTVLSSSHNAGSTTVTTQETTVPATITTLDLAIQPKGFTDAVLYSPTINTPTVTEGTFDDPTVTDGSFTNSALTTPTVSDPTVTDGTFTDASLVTPTVTSPTHTIVSHADAATITMDMEAATVHKIAALTANRTLAVSNPVAGRSLRIIIDNNGFTPSFFAGIIWEEGDAPTPSAGIDIYDFFYDGVSYYGSIYGQNFS